MEWILAVLGALLLGHICVRWHDCGIACVCSACAGCLTAAGLSVLRTPSPTLFGSFLAGFSLLLLLDAEPERSHFWLEEWRMTLRRLTPYSILIALLAGLSKVPFALIPLACIASALSRLSWRSISDAVRLGAMLIVSAALGTIAAPYLVPWMNIIRGALCAFSLYLSGCHLMPMAHRLYPGRQTAALFFLFVFLICYYTNCIIPM